MFKNKHNEMFDRVGESLVKASGLDPEQGESITSSAGLFARVQARIDKGSHSTGSSIEPGWIGGLLAASRAIPALALLAALAVSALWVTAKDAKAAVPSPQPADEAVKLVAAGGTCALSNAAECAISSEEVLATMFSGGEVPK